MPCRLNGDASLFQLVTSAKPQTSLLCNVFDLDYPPALFGLLLFLYFYELRRPPDPLLKHVDLALESLVFPLSIETLFLSIMKASDSLPSTCGAFPLSAEASDCLFNSWILLCAFLIPYSSLLCSFALLWS